MVSGMGLEGRFRKNNAQSLYFLPANSMHPANTYFHFSFGPYYNAKRMGFGALRVLNDDEVLPFSGFERHAHRQVEIVSYIVTGELTHWDSVSGEEAIISRGSVQAISAGSGIWHSEMNQHSQSTRFIQMWFVSPELHQVPRYRHLEVLPEERKNRLLKIVGDRGNKPEGGLYLYQDINVYAAELTDSHKIVSYELAEGRQAFVNNLEGTLRIGGVGCLEERESLELLGPALIEFSPSEYAHFILIEMEASNG